jgi:tetratricopeptide (TPR) repeat protein
LYQRLELAEFMNPIFHRRAQSLSLCLSLALLCLGQAWFSKALGQSYSGYPSYGAPIPTQYPNFPPPGYPNYTGYPASPGYQPYQPYPPRPAYQQPGYRQPASFNPPPQPNYYQQTPPPQTSTQYVPADDGYAQNDERIDEYARYSEQASELFNKGQLTQAIELFEKALSVAPQDSIPVVYNNLAVAYMRRGNYFHDHGKQDVQATNDHRRAYFYLETAWPEGQERKPLHEANRKVAKDNLNISYRNLGINASDKNKHLEMAKQLRMQGKFPEAIVEYSLALDLDKNDATTAKALGDLFTVVNLPEKSKKYYALAVKNAGSSTGGKGNGLAEDEMLVQLGNAQYKTGEVDKAVANFDKALALNPNNVSALNMLEKIWLNEIKFNPSSVLGHANLGSVYQKKKMYDLAQQQYSAAESFADRDPKTTFDTKKLIRLNMGTLFQAKKQYELAQKAYDTVLQVDPNHLQANFYKASLLEESGNTDGAIQAYNKVLSIDPNYRPAQEKMLTLIKQQSDPVRLANGLRQYADRFPNNALIQAQVGEEFHQRKDLNNAAIFYQKAIQLDPKLASAWANLGALYQEQGKDEESANAFRKAQELEPNNPTFKELAKNAQSGAGYKAYQEAVSLQQEGKTQEALAVYQKALAISDTPEIRAAYGIALQSAGRLSDAIAQYQQALGKDANNADYHYYLGTAWHQQNDLPKAKAEYQKALSLKPGYKEAKDALASIEQQAASAELEKAINAYNGKNYASALTFANQALAANPQDAMAHYYKGLILDAQKKPTLAAQSYREAIRRNPDFSDAYYALGVALDTAKDPKGARTAFEKFISLSGSEEDDFVKYAKERVKALSQTANF